jgi:hypothetical protein
MRQSFYFASSFVVLAIFGCSKSDPPAPAAPGSAAPAASQGSSAPAMAEPPKAEEKADFGVVATSESDFLLYAVRGVAFVDAAGFLARLDGPFQQDPAVQKGLDKGTSGAIHGSWPNGAWLVASSTTWKWVNGQWAQNQLLRENETVLDIAAWDDDRAVAAIAMPNNDMRFFLAGGKPGVVVPSPYPADKPKAAPAPAEPAAAEGEGSEGAAPAEDDRSCKVKMSPTSSFKLAGLPTGHLFAAGHGCQESGRGDAMVERWEPKKVRGVVEALPKPDGGGDIDIRGVTARSATEAYVWGVGGTKAYVAKFDGKAWSLEKVPFEGAPTAMSVTEDGTIFVAAPDALWKRPAGDVAWVKSAMPSPGGGSLVAENVWAKSTTEVWVTANGGGKYYLLHSKPAAKALALPGRSQMQASLSTNKRFLATEACTKPYAHLMTVGKAGDKPPKDFTALSEIFKGNKDTAGAKFIVENDGANLYVGAQAPTVEVAKKIIELYQAKNPKVAANVFCHEPVIIEKGIPME